MKRKNLLTFLGTLYKCHVSLNEFGCVTHLSGKPVTYINLRCALYAEAAGCSSWLLGLRRSLFTARWLSSAKGVVISLGMVSAMPNSGRSYRYKKTEKVITTRVPLALQNSNIPTHDAYHVLGKKMCTNLTACSMFWGLEVIRKYLH
jgi:hypothetical protein